MCHCLKVFDIVLGRVFPAMRYFASNAAKVPLNVAMSFRNKSIKLYFESRRN